MIGKNNYLNIRVSSGFCWYGQTGSTKGFCDFESIDMCRRAGIYLLRRSYRRANIKTVKQIVFRWALVTEFDPEVYLAIVCKLTGFYPTDVMVFDSDYASILSAMEVVENCITGIRRISHYNAASEQYLRLCESSQIRNYEVRD